MRRALLIAGSVFVLVLLLPLGIASAQTRVTDHSVLVSEEGQCYLDGEEIGWDEGMSLVGDHSGVTCVLAETATRDVGGDALPATGSRGSTAWAAAAFIVLGAAMRLASRRLAPASKPISSRNRTR